MLEIPRDYFQVEHSSEDSFIYHHLDLLGSRVNLDKVSVIGLLLEGNGLYFREVSEIYSLPKVVIYFVGDRVPNSFISGSAVPQVIDRASNKIKPTGKVYVIGNVRNKMVQDHQAYFRVLVREVKPRTVEVISANLIRNEIERVI